MWNRALINLGNPPQEDGSNKAMLDISQSGSGEWTKEGFNVVQQTGQTFHASSEKHKAHYQCARLEMIGRAITFNEGTLLIRGFI